MRFKCPFCKAVNTIDDDQPQREIACQECEKRIHVPRTQKRPEEGAHEERIRTVKPIGAAPSEKGEPPRRSRTRQPASQGYGLLLAALGVGGLLLTCTLTACVSVFLLGFLTKPVAENPPAIAKVNEGPREEVPKKPDVDPVRDKGREPEKPLDPVPDKGREPEKPFDPVPDKEQEPIKTPAPVPKKKPIPPRLPEPDEPPAPIVRLAGRDLQGDKLPEGAIARLGTTRFLHGGNVQAIAYSPDGKLLASAGNNKLIRIWDSRSGREVMTLSGHQQAVRGIAFVKNPDGKPSLLLVSGSVDKTVRIWDLDTGAEKKVINLPAPCGALAVSTDGQLIAAGTSFQNGDVLIYGFADGAQRQRWRAHAGGVFALAFSPDGKTVASGGSKGNGIPNTPNDDYALALWDTATGDRIHAFAGHTEIVRAVAFAPDGATLASGGIDLATGRSARIWDAKTFKTIHTLKGPFGGQVDARAIAYSNDGSLLAAPDFAHVYIWETATGNHQETIDIPGHKTIEAIAFDANAWTLAFAGENGNLARWNIARREWRKLAAAGHTQNINAVAISRDGKKIVTAGNDASARLWDLETAQVVREFTNPKKPGVSLVHDAAFSPDGKTVVTANHNQGVICWNVEDGAVRRHILADKIGGPRIVSVAFAPDGKSIATESVDEAATNLWNPETGELIRSFPRSGRGQTVAFSGDGKWLAAGSDQVSVFDVNTGARRLNLPARAVAVAYSKANKLIAASSSFDVRIFDAEKGKPLATFKARTHHYAYRGVAFSPDGKYLAVAELDKLSLRDAMTGKELHALTGHQASPTCVAFSFDGALLISAGEDCTALVWDMAKISSLKK
jgi:WD40 repeat protein